MTTCDAKDQFWFFFGICLCLEQAQCLTRSICNLASCEANKDHKQRTKKTFVVCECEISVTAFRKKKSKSLRCNFHDASTPARIKLLGLHLPRQNWSLLASTSKSEFVSFNLKIKCKAILGRASTPVCSFSSFPNTCSFLTAALQKWADGKRAFFRYFWKKEKKKAILAAENNCAFHSASLLKSAFFFLY